MASHLPMLALVLLVADIMLVSSYEYMPGVSVCAGKRPDYLFGDPNDCNDKFYYCAEPNTQRQCAPGGLHFSQVHQVCVWPYSDHDTCAQQNAQRECIKLMGAYVLIAHPTNCKRWYDCSDTSPRAVGSDLGGFEKECPDGQLWDLWWRQCRDEDTQGLHCGAGREIPAPPPPPSDPFCGLGSCYRIVSGIMRQEDANDNCVNEGYDHLLEINSPEEQAFIENLIDTQSMRTQYLLNGEDGDDEGVWIWASDGTPLTGNYVNWASGQPNGGIVENCMVLGSGFGWNDWDCNLGAASICERPDMSGSK